jgi:Fe-S-cluster-containing dehydrogenase component
MRRLRDSCPYGQISWNEELSCAQKCTMCAHLLDQGWKEPRCVAACPLRALKLVEWDDDRKEEMVKKLGLETLTGRDGAVWYRSLYRYQSVFIAGSVACTENGMDTCAAGTKVVLVKDGETVAKKKTDVFGDFKLDKLAPGSGTYTLKLTKPGHPEKIQTVELAEESLYLGTIRLD